MTTAQALPPRVLYERDETAWLETMAELIRLGRLDEVDYPSLAEYLTDMARRDRREVESRLTLLIAHALKWAHQPDRQASGSPGVVLDRVIPDTGADASVLPWADCQVPHSAQAVRDTMVRGIVPPPRSGERRTKSRRVSHDPGSAF